MAQTHNDIEIIKARTIPDVPESIWGAFNGFKSDLQKTSSETFKLLIENFKKNPAVEFDKKIEDLTDQINQLNIKLIEAANQNNALNTELIEANSKIQALLDSPPEVKKETVYKEKELEDNQFIVTVTDDNIHLMRKMGAEYKREFKVSDDDFANDLFNRSAPYYINRNYNHLF